MQFVNKQKDKLVYEIRVQLYDKPPCEDISLHEFKRLAENRLNVLRCVENARLRHEDRDNEVSHSIPEVNKSLPLGDLSRNHRSAEECRKVDELRRDDHYSHFILLLAYCRTEELRRWFLAQETELFRYRFHGLGPEDRKDFLQYYKNELHFAMASSEELVGHAARYLQSSPVLYKVHFSRALGLVQSRRAVIHKGYAYVPTKLLESLVVGHFRTRLSESLAVMKHHIAGIDEDDRLRPFLKGLSGQYTGEQYTNITTETIRPEQINELAKESFPLCMRALHNQLRSEHHLRHGGRMQYGLFLKGVGLNLEQSIKFWRKEFTHKMDPDQFDKSYLYNVRHNYGKEGRRANYTPFSCTRIIMANPPSAGDHHGCPFRHWDPPTLQTHLRSLGLGTKGVLEVMERVTGGHYQLACQAVFELTHPGCRGQLVVEHPNGYYLESRKARGAVAMDTVDNNNT